MSITIKDLMRWNTGEDKNLNLALIEYEYLEEDYVKLKESFEILEKDYLDLEKRLEISEEDCLDLKDLLEISEEGYLELKDMVEQVIFITYETVDGRLKFGAVRGFNDSGNHVVYDFLDNLLTMVPKNQILQELSLDQVLDLLKETR